jgi:Ring finger domain
MDCPICYEELGVARTTMSCSHSFHFRCLSNWFVTKHTGSCPICRKKAAKLEDLARPAVALLRPMDDLENEVFEYLRAEYPAPSLVPNAFLQAGICVRAINPPYTLAKAKDVLELLASAAQGVDDEDEEEVAVIHADKQAFEGLERWQRLRRLLPQTLTAN